MARQSLVDQEAPNIGLGETGLNQRCLYSPFVADEAIAIGNIVKASVATEGRVQKTDAIGDFVIGVALDAAAGAGDPIRVALYGICQVLVSTATATVFGVTNLRPSATAGQAGAGAAVSIGSSNTILGMALETSASGSARLVLMHLAPAKAAAAAAPSAGYPVDVAAAEGDGSATTPALADHVHKLGIGTTKGDILVHNGTTFVRVPVGANGLFLKADSADAEGVVWDTVEAELPDHTHGGAGDGGTTIQIPVSGGGFVTLSASSGLSISNASLELQNDAQLMIGIYGTSTATGTQNNFAFPRFALRWEAASALTLTGIAGGQIRRMSLLINAGTANIVLNHENAGSSAGNRFTLPAAGNFTLAPGEAVWLWYDGNTSRWRVIANAA